MKHASFVLSLFSTCLIALSSCQSATEEVESVTFKYTFSGFDVTTGSIDELSTRTVAASPNSLLVVDVVDDKYVQSVSRVSSANALEDVTLDLTKGQHKIYFVCGTQAWTQFDESALSVAWNETTPPGETWSAVVPINVTGPSSSSTPVDLKHAVAYARIQMTDAIPSGVSYIKEVLVGASYTFNLLTQCGAAAATVSKTVEIPASYLGRTDVTLGIFAFVPQGVTKANSFSVIAYDSKDQEIASHDFSDVSMEANNYVLYKGQFFPAQSVNQGFLLSADQNWDERTTIDY